MQHNWQKLIRNLTKKMNLHAIATRYTYVTGAEPGIFQDSGGFLE